MTNLEHNSTNAVESQKIKDIITQRKIKNLFHFTLTENLQSIIECGGLLSRSRLEEEKLVFLGHDSYRHDKCPEAVSLSVSFPNYKMFFKFFSSSKKTYAIIIIDSCVLYEHECYFCKTNAAAKTESRKVQNHRNTAKAFESMFDEIEGKLSRKETGLSSSYPTDPQAEVLVFGKIELKDIRSICFASEEEADEFERKIDPALLGEVKITYDSDGILWKPRHDWFNWRG